MNYSQCLSYIHSMPKFPKELGLDRFRAALALFANPQNSLRYIHIAGTNGKGSAAGYLSSVLSYAGIKTGKFISPFIEVFNERISIDEINISDADLCRLTSAVKKELDAHPELYLSEFELVTLLGFIYFNEQKCDLVVLETGLGGRLDATNIITAPLVSVITKIDLDHMQYLGNTVEAIAFEKCGIIKPGCPVVVYPDQYDKVFEVIRQQADIKNSPVTVSHFPDIILETLGESIFSYGKYKNIKIHLSGSYQILNAATALEALSVLQSEYGIAIPDCALYEGFENTSHPVRFEIVHKNPYIILDGGHNFNGIASFMSSMLNYSCGKKIIAVVGMLSDKNYRKCVELIAESSALFIATEVPNPRSVNCSSLAEIADKKCVTYQEKNSVEAVKLAVSLASSEDYICVFGSLYLLGDIRKFMNQKLF